MNISKNEEEKNTVFLNLLKPQKSASRLGENLILTNLSKKKVSFPENCNFRKWSSRVGESSIFKILQENEKWKRAKVRHPLETIFCNFLESILGSFCGHKSIKNLSLFQTSFSDAFWCKI